MKKSSQTTVHTRIGHERSLCGQHPERGNYTILSFSAFFATKEKDQCGRCINLLKLRGYNITKDREKFQALQMLTKQHASLSSTPQLAF